MITAHIYTLHEYKLQDVLRDGSDLTKFKFDLNYCMFSKNSINNSIRNI